MGQMVIAAVLETMMTMAQMKAADPVVVAVPVAAAVVVALAKLHADVLLVLYLLHKSGNSMYPLQP